jgi:hypothetical protein
LPPNIQYCTYYNRDRDSINTGLFDDCAEEQVETMPFWIYVTN